MIVWDDGGSAPPTIKPELDRKLHANVKRVPTDFSDVFSTKPGSTKLAEHWIETGSAKPVCQLPYRLSYAYQETIRPELQEMKWDGIIESLTSEWASPIVLVQDYAHVPKVEQYVYHVSCLPNTPSSTSISTL